MTLINSPFNHTINLSAVIRVILILGETKILLCDRKYQQPEVYAISTIKFTPPAIDDEQMLY